MMMCQFESWWSNHQSAPPPQSASIILTNLLCPRKCTILAQVRDLDLSGVKTGGDIDIECFTSEFANLETLDLSNSTITNLRGFPKLKNLKKLELSSNRLSRGLEILKECPNLTQISLQNNKIKELEVLEPLGHLKHLTHLEVNLDHFLFIVSNPYYAMIIYLPEDPLKWEKLLKLTV